MLYKIRPEGLAHLSCDAYRRCIFMSHSADSKYRHVAEMELEEPETDHMYTIDYDSKLELKKTRSLNPGLN